LWLRNHKVTVSSKHDQVRIDGVPHNFSRPAFAAGVVNGGDEITERHQPFRVIGFHAMTISGEPMRAL
jgi:hypothetical protein